MLGIEAKGIYPFHRSSYQRPGTEQSGEMTFAMGLKPTLLLYTSSGVFARGLRGALEPSVEVRVSPPTPGGLLEAVTNARPELLLLEEIHADAAMISVLKRRYPYVQVMVCMYSNLPERFLQLLDAGVSALLSGSPSDEEIATALSTVLDGRRYYPDETARVLSHARRCNLTPRESELLRRVAEGLANKEIAWQLGIGEGTVKVYLSRLFDKLGVSDRYELALLGLRNGAREVPSLAAVYLSGNTKPPVRRGTDRSEPALLFPIVPAA